MPFKVVLFEPEIPPNTGNVIRICANVGAELHLVEPLGFEMDNTRLRRAGLDYHELTHVQVHASLAECLAVCGDGLIYAVSTRAARQFSDAQFAAGDILMFGPETRGLPEEVLEGVPPAQRLRIPMRAESRSMNLANAVSVVIYEGWRQLGYPRGV
ncbi:MAG: tRNA (cytidine(34)-2'-O)-methyltransferase [Gammaproteobacteria bacterium]|nr:tRNA (cytidine(34)-2'-O)-methyltransferase [Gammaproteobacteria bacterium]